MGRDRDRHPGERCLVERGVHHPAATGAPTFLQGRENADHRPHPGGEIDDRHADPHRRSPVLAHQAHQPPIGLHQRVVAGPLAQRPDRAERPEIAIDEARLPGGQHFSRQTVTVERAEFEIVEHHIGAAEDQRLQLFDFGRIGEVDRDATLRSVDRVKAGCRTFREGRPPAAGGVAGARVLDFDYLGAELAEDHARIRRSDTLTDLDHNEAG